MTTDIVQEEPEVSHAEDKAPDTPDTKAPVQRVESAEKTENENENRPRRQEGHTLNETNPKLQRQMSFNDQDETDARPSQG